MWADVLLLVVVAWSAAVVTRGLLVRDIQHEEDGMTQAGPIATVVDVLEELLAGHLDGVVSVTVQPRERRSERWRLLVVVRDRDHAAVPTTHTTPACTHAPAPQKGHGGPNEDSIRRTGPSELPHVRGFANEASSFGLSLPVPSTPPPASAAEGFQGPIGGTPAGDGMREIAERVLEHAHASALMGGDALTRAEASKQLDALARAYLEAERAINDIVRVLGCGGDERFVPASDPLQDNDGPALEIARAFLAEHEPVNPQGGLK